MKAVVWHDITKISVDEVPDPQIRDPADAIVRITTSAICGTDLHFVRGTMPAYGPAPFSATKPSASSSKLGNCNHRRYVPGLLSRIASGRADPTTILTQQQDIPTALEAYEAFDRREPGWTKVTLELSG